jgi:3-oxoacyl-[acyl-carrier protein] reductase
MKLLKGKTAIITGASRGIGSGIATVFAQQGADVAFTYSSSSEAAETLEKSLQAYGTKVKGYQSAGIASRRCSAPRTPSTPWSYPARAR